MKNLKIILALFLFAQVYLYSFPDILELNSGSGNIIYSDTTELGKNYYITVSGTYSMWPSYDSYGVDGAYLYDVPQEEIDALRWPPERIEIFGQEYELYDLPMWLGTNNEIPPPDLDIPGLNIRIVSREHIGLRVDGNWLENTGYNPSTHTYKFKIKGTGNPITFQILDSSYSITENRVVPKYWDNSGSLTINIDYDKQNDTILKLKDCNSSFVFEEGTDFYKFEVALFEEDTSGLISNNLLKDSNLKMIIDNDTIQCEKYECLEQRDKVSIGFIIDNSGSMLAGNTKNDTQMRIDAVYDVIYEIRQNLNFNDEIAFGLFNSKKIVIQDWIENEKFSDMNFNSLFQTKTGWQSNLYDAIPQIFDSLKHNNNVNWIIFSDFSENYTKEPNNDNLSNFFEMPLYLINFGNGGAQSDGDNQNVLEFFDSNFDSVVEYKFPYLNSFPDDMIDKYLNYNYDDCCSYYFILSPCRFSKDTVLNAQLIYEDGEHYYSYYEEIEFNCNGGKISTKALPYKFLYNQDEVIIQKLIKEKYSYKVLDYNGYVFEENNLEPLNYINISGFDEGVYFFVIYNSQQQYSEKIIILR